MLKIRILIISMLLPLISCLAQLNTLPVFPKETDSITVFFDASKGNAALKGLVSQEVYAHSGVITNLSTSNANWRYVQGTWATADAKMKMKSLGNDLYSIRFHVKNFYGVPTLETIKLLAFVFRNRDGSIVGRSSDGSDIYTPIYSNTGLFAKITDPSDHFLYKMVGDSVTIVGQSSINATLEIKLNALPIELAIANTISKTIKFNTSGTNQIIFSAFDGTTNIYDTLNVICPNVFLSLPLPTGVKDGVNFINDSTIVLSLYAPGKQFVFITGDFNNWSPNISHQMNRTPDGNRYWIQISNLKKGNEYAYQYLIDGKIKVADPLSIQVLDPSNDSYISSSIYPNLKSYPTGKTSGITSLIKVGRTPYVWKSTSYMRPKKTDLVVYELLIRDFTAARSFKSTKDSIPYLKKMGINCIELMPIMEFEGNNSWGYNVSYHGALDKAYGTIEDFKSFVDECHKNNIAVVLDIALNHAFSQNSLCQMWWDAANYRPSTNNPYLNPIAKHPFNVGYDFNHESQATKNYIDQILKYWITEFKIDGYRFDLSKGFTQKNTGDDVGAWGVYDQSRIDLLKRMGDQLKAIDSDLFLILEHFADNSEETVLSNYGFMLWGNMVYHYNECAMGFTSDLSWGSHKSRGWSQNNLVSYLESHDEERLMVKNVKFGNSSGTYNTKDVNTALKRLEMAGNLFFTIPGPKMIYQFGELGYDISIDQNGRTGEKPIRWSYLNVAERKHLQSVWSELIKLKTNEDVFESNDITLALSTPIKTITLKHVNNNMVAIANSNVSSMTSNINFPSNGTWYEYFSGDSINVLNNTFGMTLQAGAYKLYFTKKLKSSFTNTVKVNSLKSEFKLSPNPTNNIVSIQGNFNLINQIEITNYMGQKMNVNTDITPNHTIINLSNLPKGIYYITILSDLNKATWPILKL